MAANFAVAAAAGPVLPQGVEQRSASPRQQDVAVDVKSGANVVTDAQAGSGCAGPAYQR
jgi:hypothetical protein